MTPLGLFVILLPLLGFTGHSSCRILNDYFESVQKMKQKTLLIENWRSLKKNISTNIPKRGKQTIPLSNEGLRANIKIFRYSTIKRIFIGGN